MFIVVLFVITMFWEGIFYLSAQEYTEWSLARERPYQVWDKGRVMLFSGFILYSVWTAIAIAKRNVKIIVAIAGIIIAFCFFFAANTENIGYAVEEYAGFDHAGYELTLNPLLHLGGGSIESKFGDPKVYAYLSSMSVRNLLLYLS